MVKTITTALHLYMEPLVVQRVSLFNNSNFSFGVLQEYDKNDDDKTGFCKDSVEIINRSSIDVVTTTRLGISRRYTSTSSRTRKPAGGLPTEECIEFRISLSLDTAASFTDAQILTNHLFDEHGNNEVVYCSFLSAVRKVLGDSWSVQNRYVTLVFRLNVSYLKKINRPIYIGDLDLVIGLAKDAEYQYHPEQPGAEILNIPKEAANIKGSKFTSMFYVDNTGDKLRELWVVNGTDISLLRPQKRLGLKDGVYLYKGCDTNVKLPDGDYKREALSIYVPYDEFRTSEFVYTEYSTAKAKVDLVTRAMNIEEVEVLIKENTAKTSENILKKTELTTNEKRSDKLFDNVATIVKYAAILIPAVIYLLK